MKTLLLTVVIFPLVGAATASLLRLPVPRPPVARLSLLFLLGLGAHGLLLYGLGVFRVPLGIAAFVALPAVAAVVLLLRRTFRVLPHQPERASRPAAVLFAAPLIVLVWLAAVMPTRDYDGRVTWLPKARAIALEASITGPFFHGQRGLNVHNHYPVLLPLGAATVMRLASDTRNEAARWIFVLIPIAALIVLRSMLVAWFGSTGAWIAAVPPWLPFLTAIEGGALAAYSDLAVTAFAGVAVLYLIEAGGDARAVHCAGLFAAFAVATKNEGMALAGGVVLAALLVRGWQAVIPVAAAEGIVVYWRTLVPPAFDEPYEKVLGRLPRALGRLPEAVAAVVRHAADFTEWGIFWIAVAAAIAVCAVRARAKAFAIPLVVIAVALASYITALLVTTWRIEDIAPVSMNRLLAQLIIPATVILALAVHTASSLRTSRGE